jgi:peptidoglycan DL-endopeptidase CwlO
MAVLLPFLQSTNFAPRCSPRGGTCYGPRLVKAHSTSDAARLAAVFTGFLLLASVPVAFAADSAGLPARAAGLRADSGSLEARATAATLELYSLEAQLDRVRAERASIAARRLALARKQASARTQLAIAKQAVSASQAELADLVRALYQQPGHDPLAVLLGAKSLDEALTALDGISRAAGRNNRIVEQARDARTRLEGVGRRLAARARELDRLAAAADAQATALAASTAERQRYVAGLRRQQGLNAARVASIEAQAREAETRSIAVSAAAPGPAPSAEEIIAPVSLASGTRTLTVTSTGYSITGRTATGIQTGPGVVAVDPAVIPLGTRLVIPGYGVGVAADTGGAVQGNTIDLWFPTLAEADRWGRRTVTITLR